MNEGKTNLFVYGSLRDSRIFKSVCGLSFSKKPSKISRNTLFAEPALLPQYRRVSPDDVYFYAIAAPSSKIEGLVIYDIPAGVMTEIDRYEGKRYERETVRINTASGLIEAQAYLVSHDSMEKHFGDRFHVNLIHELWLRKRIEKFIKKRTRPGERTLDADLERRAERELLATTERDLVMSHYHSDAVSDYFLEHELDRPRPSIKHLREIPEAQPFIKNYLKLVVKQVLLSQLDEHIQSRYRFELERMRTSERYFKRSVSLLVALQMINANPETVAMIVNECLQTMPYQKNDLIDYVKYAVRAAKSMFEARVAHSNLERVRSNFHPGLTPLGIEVELSNLGAAAVEPQRSKQKAFDPVYDGFMYFYDFHLDVLSWKLGGYIDDHTGSTDQGRRRGFLELAPGRLNIEGELSRPATADPWLLSQLIHEITNFYEVQPHSLHISLQLRKNQLNNQQILPLSFVKCLLVLGGGPERRHTGRMWVSRMGYDEIKQYQLGEELVFARASKRRWYLGGDDIANKPPAQATTYVQQYKFIRLDRRANFEPLVMCLKGLQLAYNPGDYLTSEQLRENPKLQEQYEELKQWAVEPTEISPQTIGKFVKTVKEGLMIEGHRRPVHQLHYIDWALSAIDVQLRMFNKQISETS
ncbi:MAG: gamma-glutamylcyclotransferase [Sedimentisphaerales bacterium]|nr:gamma-glutamylcyclotransferase [Sedimentisphaerales bacterium]